jgi:hypothetical protein
MDTSCIKAALAAKADADIDDLQYENMILKEQLKFLMECITNQMNNLELLCESSKNGVIHKDTLKPYYEKSYRCNIYI